MCDHEEIRRLRRALTYALEAFQKSSTIHACDYCAADAREIGRALDGADILDPADVLADAIAVASGTTESERKLT